MKAHAWYRWNTICLENNWLTDRLYVEAGQHISFDYMQQDLKGSTGIHNYIVINHPSWDEFKLEQLQRLRSEIPPAAPWLPILVIHIRSQVKTTQSQSYKF